MTIPNPTPDGVAKFKTLYRELRGEDLDDDKALELATRYLHFVFFGIATPPTLNGSMSGKPDDAAHQETLPAERAARGRRSGKTSP